MKNKKMATIIASVLAICVIVGGAFALFQDNAEGAATTTVGNVKVAVEGNLTHSEDRNNINPGDNDPTQNTGYRTGSDHELSFKVDNLGNKSIITRTVIKITGKDAENNDLTAEVLENIILSERTVAADKAADTDSDKFASVSPLTDFTVTDNTLTYVIGGKRVIDILNGTGNNAEEEANVNTTVLNKTFDIGLNKTVGTKGFAVELMGAKLTFHVEVQAMQYRNTGSNDWATIFTETFDAYTPDR